MFRRLNKSAYW